MNLYNTFEVLISRDIYLFYTFLFILGLCLGSFLNVFLFRYPLMDKAQDAIMVEFWLQEQSIPAPEGLKALKSEQNFNLSTPDSHCFNCKTKISWYQNIPILSYLFLRGKCGTCQHPISIQYPLVELFFGITLPTLIYLLNVSSPETALLAIIVVSLSIFLSAIDMKTQILPEGLNYSFLWIILLFAAFGVHLNSDITLSQSIIGAATGYLMQLLTLHIGLIVMKKDVIGGGDLKLMAGIGALTGIEGVIFSYFIAPFFGLLFIALLSIKEKTNKIPYGPSLLMAGFLYLIYGKELLLLIS